MYQYEIKPFLQKILKRLFKKDKPTLERIIKKVEEIINSNSINHYKNLRHNMKDCKRVHIGHFVLVFSFDESRNLISFEDFDHHDNIYKKKF
jgi:YafQ family addiction module toxin component|tara:strand:+ start:730 stop:1005 length:276 start_codon:yes stop_codon:yes gene_type:complete